MSEVDEPRDSPFASPVPETEAGATPRGSRAGGDKATTVFGAMFGAAAAVPT
jgi:hypothetical protein